MQANGLISVGTQFQGEGSPETMTEKLVKKFDES